jgi:hypothetical protein
MDIEVMCYICCSKVVRNNTKGLPMLMGTVTYIMVMMVSNEGIQGAAPLTVHSCPIFVQVNIASRLHFHKKNSRPTTLSHKKNARLTTLSHFVSSQNWLEVQTWPQYWKTKMKVMQNKMLWKKPENTHFVFLNWNPQLGLSRIYS